MYLRLLATAYCVFVTAGSLSAEEAEESVNKHSVRIRILLVESPGKLVEEGRRQLSGPTDKVMSALSKLEREENATIINQVDMTVLEECQGMLQIGETVSIRTGTVRLGGRGEQVSYESVNTGTIVQLKSKVSGDQVLVDLDFSKSAVRPRTEQDEIPQGTSQLTHQTTIKIKNGNALAVGEMVQHSGDQSKGIVLIVAADILESSNVQMMKFQSFSRPRVPGGTMPPRGRGLSSERPSPAEIQNRLGSIVESMFNRADVDKDGVISEDEVDKLGVGGFEGKPPITRDQLFQWMTSRLGSAQRSIRRGGLPRSGLRGPTPPQTEREASDRKE